MPRFPAALTAVLIALSILLSACQNVQTPRPVVDTPAASPSSRSSATGTNNPTRTTGTAMGPTPQRLTLTPPANATSAPTDLLITPEALRGVEIHFWHGWAGESARQMQELVDTFNQDNIWGVRVVIDAVGGNAVLFDRVKAAIEMDAAPHLVAAPLDYLANWHAQHDAVVNLEAYVSSADWGLSAAEVEDFNPTFWEELAHDGTRLGIPAERTTQVLFYNQAWAQELGFSRPPASTAEFQQQACAAAKALAADGDKTNDGMGGWVIDRDSLTLLSWMTAFGAQSPATGSAPYTFNTPESAAAFAYLRGLFDAGCAWLSRNPLPYEYFANRQALFHAGELGEIALQAKVNQRFGIQDSWTVLPFPSRTGQPVLVSSGSSFAVLKHSPAEQLAAWLLMRWLILPRNQARLVAAGLTLPVGEKALQEVSTLRQPQWRAIVRQMEALSPSPGLPDWWLARNILEDAGWQMLQPTPLPPATVLKQLDDTLADILQYQSQQP